jgi:hypothetical protein
MMKALESVIAAHRRRKIARNSQQRIRDLFVAGRNLTIAAAGHQRRQRPEDNATMPRPTPNTPAVDGPLRKFQKMPAFERPDPALKVSPE